MTATKKNDYRAEAQPRDDIETPSSQAELWWSRKEGQWVVAVAKDWYTARIILKWNTVQRASSWRKELNNAEAVPLP
jgi:hypothetical protein